MPVDLYQVWAECRKVAWITLFSGQIMGVEHVFLGVYRGMLSDNDHTDSCLLTDLI